MDRWVGKVAVVTGASSGIGQNIAQELAERGMTVVGVARRAELVEELAKKLSGSKGQLHALKADIGNEEDVVKAFEWIRKNVGSIHVLVNNAGIAPYTFLSKLERDDYKKIRGCFDVNVMGLVMCSNEAIKLMRERGIDDGHIFNINSVAGHYVGNMPGFFPYTASKFAVTVITEGLRRELLEAKSKIRVTSVSPGLVDTNIGAPSGIPNFEEMVANAPCLKSEDITRSLIHALTAPPDVQITEIMVRPVGEQF